MKKLNILITNDDGYEAKGLLAVVQALKDIANLIVVAPSTEKSACSHSLTLTRPLRFICLDDNFYKLDDGTPGDCVYLALNSLYDNNKPDLVISGINRGSNMGEDITYSGTCAGAMEAVLHDVPAIAISQVVDFSDKNNDYAFAARVIKELILKITNSAFPLPKREFLNVNIPLHAKEIKFEVTYAGYRNYANEAYLHRNPRGEEYFWLGLHPLSFNARDKQEGICDYEAIENGYVSITPIMLDLSAYKSMDKLKTWL